MTQQALIELARRIQKEKCEHQNIEVKSALGGTPKRLYDSLSSFSNQEGGGIIIFGISEEEGFAIVGIHNVQKLQDQVAEQCKQMEPEIRPVFTACEIDGKMVVSLEIPEINVHDKPCFYKGTGRLKGSYVRVGGQDIQMTEYEVYSYEAFKQQIYDDLKIVERANIADFDPIVLSNFIMKLQTEKPKLVNLEKNEILKLQGIAIDSKPTVAGIMIFGKYPQGFFPQLAITAIVVKSLEAFDFDSGERFIDNQRIEGTIPEMLNTAIAFVRRNMKVATVIDGKTAKRTDKEEFPLIAVREIILNALVHRDYSSYTNSSPIRLVIYPNRIEVENPGGLYGRLTVDRLGKAAGDTRNTFIANILEISIDNENRFSGIPTIRKTMKDNGLPEPKFESARGVFRATLYNASHIQKEQISDAAILDFCKTPRMRNEISSHFGITSISYLVKNYLIPLADKGLLKLTLPNTPKSKNQKYYS